MSAARLLAGAERVKFIRARARAMGLAGGHGHGNLRRVYVFSSAAAFAPRPGPCVVGKPGDHLAVYEEDPLRYFTNPNDGTKMAGGWPNGKDLPGCPDLHSLRLAVFEADFCE